MIHCYLTIPQLSRIAWNHCCVTCCNNGNLHTTTRPICYLQISNIRQVQFFSFRFHDISTKIDNTTKVELFDEQLDMNKVAIKILQGSVFTQTVLGGLTIRLYPPVANFLYCILVCAKNYESWYLVVSRQSYLIIMNSLLFASPGM